MCAAQVLGWRKGRAPVSYDLCRSKDADGSRIAIALHKAVAASMAGVATDPWGSRGPHECL